VLAAAFIPLSFLASWAFTGFLPSSDLEAAAAFQARVFLTGHLVLPETPLAPFFAAPWIWHEGAWFAPLAPGWPLALAPFMLLGVPFLLNPLLGSLAVGLVIGLPRRLGLGHVARGWLGPGLALGLVLLAPWSPAFTRLSPWPLILVAALLVCNGVAGLWRAPTLGWAFAAGSGAGLLLACHLPLGGAALASAGLVLARGAWTGALSLRLLLPALLVGLAPLTSFRAAFHSATTGSMWRAPLAEYCARPGTERDCHPVPHEPRAELEALQAASRALDAELALLPDPGSALVFVTLKAGYEYPVFTHGLEWTSHMHNWSSWMARRLALWRARPGAAGPVLALDHGEMDALLAAAMPGRVPCRMRLVPILGPLGGSIWRLEALQFPEQERVVVEAEALAGPAAPGRAEVQAWWNSVEPWQVAEVRFSPARPLLEVPIALARSARRSVALYLSGPDDATCLRLKVDGLEVPLALEQTEEGPVARSVAPTYLSVGLHRLTLACPGAPARRVVMDKLLLF
jgi:hypothetical protein